MGSCLKTTAAHDTLPPSASGTPRVEVDRTFLKRLNEELTRRRPTVDRKVIPALDMSRIGLPPFDDDDDTNNIEDETTPHTEVEACSSLSPLSTKIARPAHIRQSRLHTEFDMLSARVSLLIVSDSRVVFVHKQAPPDVTDLRDRSDSELLRLDE